MGSYFNRSIFWISQVTMMAKHLDTIYVSGWQCSSTHTTTNEPGPDLADYPYDTVPNKVSTNSPKV